MVPHKQLIYISYQVHQGLVQELFCSETIKLQELTHRMKIKRSSIPTKFSLCWEDMDRRHKLTNIFMSDTLGPLHTLNPNTSPKLDHF